MTPCNLCGRALLFSARQSGTGLCGPCRRTTRFNLWRWLLKQWHRFTLGKTARRIPPRNYAHPGSVAHMAYVIKTAAHHGLPCNIACEVVTRKAADVDVGTVRIVLETCE